MTFSEVSIGIRIPNIKFKRPCETDMLPPFQRLSKLLPRVLCDTFLHIWEQATEGSVVSSLTASGEERAPISENPL